ncbi:MAG TPA: chorismate mutase [Cyanobacteria bacterium UBA8156]|nr:chorismate mutase [Cyanobacteria bacterium UBA8156]
MNWRVRGIRGATTAEANTYGAIRAAVLELMSELEARNPSLDPHEVASATFSVTPDLDAVFPAQIARSRPNWEIVPFVDVQHFAVSGSLPRCIRVLLHVNMLVPQQDIRHVYLRGASELRPDLVRLP